MSDLRLVLPPRICSMLTASSEQSAARLAGSTQLLGRESIIMLHCLSVSVSLWLSVSLLS